MKTKQFIQLILIVSLQLTVVTACDILGDQDGDTQSAGTVIDADGNKYNTVKIGNQVWMVENLKTTKYNDGTEIVNVTSSTQWKNLTSGAYCNYDNRESNAAIYGRLYNWYAVNTGKLAPAGWHVPTDADWTILENYLVANGYNYDGTSAEDKIAKSLSSKTLWSFSDKVGTPGAAPENNNLTGFTALPGGNRDYDAFFIYLGNFGYWWSSTAYGTGSGYSRELYYGSTFMDRYGYYKKCGLSVRLVRD